MCGIIGAYTRKFNQVSQVLDTIYHRGPSGYGDYSNHFAMIGMRRLSIIDLDGGHQPIFSEDKRISVVFNGEIYNYKELIVDLQSKGHTFGSQSDTEVLVHLYEEYGYEMCTHLRGMFAFAIIDEYRQTMFVARDRFGKKPLYYLTQQGEVFFASEIKALRHMTHSRGVTLTISEQSIYDYLSLGVVPQPSTIYKEVVCLPPASYMVIDANGINVTEYWNLDYAPKLNISYLDATEKVRELVSESVRLRLRSDVPLGVFLSGGVDSSVVAYEAAKEVGDTLQTFTVKMGSTEFDESPIAAQTAQMLGVKNTVLPLEINPLEGLQKIVQHYDQPYADSSAIPSLEISRLARQHVTVVLNGDGGDEIFGGYRRYVAAQRLDSLHWVPNSVAKAGANWLESMTTGRRSRIGFAARFARGLAQSPSERYLTWTADMMLDSDKRSVWTGINVASTERLIESELQKLQNLSGLDQQMALDARINLLSDLLVKMDMATMAYSLEGRSPFMDHVLAETIARFPDQYKVGKVTKQILKDAYASKLPTVVTTGVKRGFEIPLEAWLEGSLRSLFQDTLGSSSSKVSAFLTPAFIQGILSKRILRDRNWKYIAYSLLVLEMWLTEFA
jgi:asparagine synthase (glutamine-hydrolysing)